MVELLVTLSHLDSSKSWLLLQSFRDEQTAYTNTWTNEQIGFTYNAYFFRLQFSVI